MNSPLFAGSTLAGLMAGLVSLSVCAALTDAAPSAGVGNSNAASETVVAQVAAAEPKASQRQATAKAENVQTAKSLLDNLGPKASYKLLPGNLLSEIIVKDGSTLSAENIALFGKLTDLETLQIYNNRELNDEAAARLAGLSNLTSLALTNSVIGDPTVEMIAKSFPNLKALDLSSNTNMTNGVLKTICRLTKLERLLLVQNRFNDVGTGYLQSLKNLQLLDLRGNMEAGDMTMEIVAALPMLTAFKHRSTTVSDTGMEYLAASKNLKSLLVQDFAITSQTGQFLARLGGLQELEIFRCQGFGSEGVLALKGMKLTRLTLRDLPMVDDQAMEVFTDLPELKRLYLHELSSLSDSGLKNLKSLQSLEVLDIWTIPQMTDATVDVIAALPNLKQLSIRTTGVTDAAISKILSMDNLQTLTFKDNASVTDEGLKKLAAKKWSKLDTGK